MSGRVEIITGPERRRRWSKDEKLQLVEEACHAGHSVSQVARQRGINPSQLFTWRRQARAKGLVSDARSEPSVGSGADFYPRQGRCGAGSAEGTRGRPGSTAT